MVKEEKTTIDGFPVRSARDSKLVARSKADKLPSNKTQVKKRTSAKKTVVKNTTVSGKSTQKSTSRRVASANVVAGMKPSTKKTTAKRKTAPKKTVAKKTVAHKKATSVTPKNTVDQIEIVDEPVKTEVQSEADERLEEEIFGKTRKAHEDFLAPVESFNFSEKEDSGTSEGRVEEVEDLEVADIKERNKAAKNAEKLKRKADKKSKKHIVVRVILVIILLLLIGAGVCFYFWGDQILKRITGGEGDIWSAIGAVTSESYDPLKEDSNGRTNVLIFGTSGYDMEGETGDGVHDGAQLTDSIMVLSLEQETGDVAMVSLPRDLNAGYTCTATGKINEVFWCANPDGTNEAAGASALQSKVEEILGLDIQYYVHVNWGSLVNIVDTLGGVTVTLDEDIFDYGWTNAEFRAGVPYTINGEQALGLARARHGTEHGDFTRGNSQQKLIIAIKDRLVQKKLSLTEMLGLVNTLGDNVRTNLNISEIKTGLHLLEELELENARQIPLVTDDTYYMTTADIGGISYVVPSAGVGVYSEIQKYVAKMLNSNPAVREGAKIEILNGSGEPGVAGEEKTKLEEEGYTITTVDDAPIGTYEYSGIEIYDTSEGLKPETKEALEKKYGVNMKLEAEPPNGISGVGYDFIIIIGK